jgi:hypothetical protein
MCTFARFIHCNEKKELKHFNYYKYPNVIGPEFEWTNYRFGFFQDFTMNDFDEQSRELELDYDFKHGLISSATSMVDTTKKQASSGKDIQAMMWSARFTRAKFKNERMNRYVFHETEQNHGLGTPTVRHPSITNF